MRKLFVLIGMTAGGWVGWALGAPIGIMIAFLLSMVGTGLGMYLGIRIAQHYS